MYVNGRMKEQTISIYPQTLFIIFDFAEIDVVDIVKVSSKTSAFLYEYN